MSETAIGLGDLVIFVQMCYLFQALHHICTVYKFEDDRFYLRQG